MLNYYQKLQLCILAWKRKCVKRSVLVSLYVFIYTVDTKIFYNNLAKNLLKIKIPRYRCLHWTNNVSKHIEKISKHFFLFKCTMQQKCLILSLIKKDIKSTIFYNWSKKFGHAWSIYTVQVVTLPSTLL